MYKEIVTTLYEKHYDYGVGALINSLVASQFAGLMVVGYKGILPFWVDQISKNGNYYSVSTGFDVEFVCLTTDMHMGYYKPSFLRECLERYSTTEKIYYFDPDIVVNAPWQFYSEWVECGVSLCKDVSFPYLHRNHPWRSEWSRLAGIEPASISKVDFYANSGFIGLERKHILLLEEWIKLTNIYKAAGKNILSFDQGIIHSAFKGDQDLLNATITVMPDIPYSVIGTEGMGFTEPAYLMYHAIGNKDKPWKKLYTKSVLQYSQKPSMAEDAYFRHIQSPIRIFSKTALAVKKIDIKFAKLLGRIFA